MHKHSKPARSRFRLLQALAGGALLMGVFLAPALPTAADESFPGDIITSDEYTDSVLITPPPDQPPFELDLVGPSNTDDAYDAPDYGLEEAPAPTEVPPYVDDAYDNPFNLEEAPAPGMTTSYPDSDWDGISDTTEITIGSNPNDSDSDDDGASDGDEYFSMGTSLTNPDTDGDGHTDHNEYVGWCAGGRLAQRSDPLDPTSVPC